MAKKEWILYLVMFLIGVVVIIESLHLGLGNAHRPGVGFLPFFTGVGLSSVALLSLTKNFLTAKRENGSEREKFLGPSMLNVVKIVVALAVYVLILPWLGYLLSTFLLFIFLFKVGGFHRWVFILVASFLTVSLSYLLFSSLLNMRFPKGFLGF